MCEPSTIAIAGLALTAVSTAVGMYGQHQQMQSANAAAKSQAEYQQSALDAEIASQEQAARDAIARGASEREKQQRNAARIMGEQRSSLAASGVALDSGTALDMLGESAMEAQHDSNIITQNAGREAYGHQTHAWSSENQKGLVASTLTNTINANKSDAYWGMGSTFLTGLGTATGQYSDWKKAQGAGTPKSWLQSKVDKSLGKKL